MKQYFLFLIMMIPFTGFSQWTKTELGSKKVKQSQEKLEFAALYTLDADQFRQSLKNAPLRFSKKRHNHIASRCKWKIRTFSGMGIFKYGS